MSMAKELMDHIAWNNAAAAFVDAWKPGNIVGCVVAGVLAVRLGWLFLNKVFDE